MREQAKECTDAGVDGGRVFGCRARVNAGAVGLIVNDEDGSVDKPSGSRVELGEPSLQVLQDLLVLLHDDEDRDFEAVQAKPERVQECFLKIVLARREYASVFSSIDQADADRLPGCGFYEVRPSYQGRRTPHQVALGSGGANSPGCRSRE